MQDAIVERSGRPAIWLGTRGHAASGREEETARQGERSRDRLYESPTLSVSDIRLRGWKRRDGRDRWASSGQDQVVVFTRGGALFHGGDVARGRSAIADATQVLLFSASNAPCGEAPATACYAGTAFSFSTQLVRAALPDGITWRADEAGPRTWHAIVPPELLLHFHRVRLTLRRRGSSALGGTHDAEGRVVALLAHVLSLVEREPRERRSRSRRSSVRRQIVDGAKALMAAAPGHPHRLPDLARALGTSESHLAHVFREETGSPVHHHLLHLRLAVALERLAAGEMRLSALALDLGFSSHSHFTAAFRKWLGLTPAAARRYLVETPR